MYSTASHHRASSDDSLLVLNADLRPPKPIAEASHWVEQLTSSSSETSLSTVTLDAANVETIDTRGIVLILEIVRRLLAEGVSVQLRDPPEVLTRCLTTMGLDSLISIGEVSDRRRRRPELSADDFDHDADAESIESLKPSGAENGRILVSA